MFRTSSVALIQKQEHPAVNRVLGLEREPVQRCAELSALKRSGYSN
jgi:hypothetical protein